MVEARADIVTADNLGVLPPAVVAELTPSIDSGRPFLESTLRLDAPIAGVGMTLPIIVVPPVAGVQEREKDVLEHTATEITSATFDPVTIGGYGDISLQLLKRSDPSYLELYYALLGESYGESCDAEGVNALLGAPGINDGGTLDPADIRIGEAATNATTAARSLPDRLWLSTAAVEAIIDAKAPGSNVPVYPLGIEAPISGLRPVHVPALDDEGVDFFIGPSSAFRWSEDGTYRLQAVQPALAGQEIALVGFVWCAPVYRAAFTRFSLESS